MKTHFPDRLNGSLYYHVQTVFTQYDKEIVLENTCPATVTFACHNLGEFEDMPPAFTYPPLQIYQNTLSRTANLHVRHIFLAPENYSCAQTQLTEPSSCIDKKCDRKLNLMVWQLE